METAIVFLAAGLSSRFGYKAKQLEKVGLNSETLIEISINEAIKAGYGKIIFVVSKKTYDPIKNIFKNEYKGTPILYVEQSFNPETRDKPWGTTDAICKVKTVIDCPFAVANSDELYGEEPFKQIKEALERGENLTIGYNLSDTLPKEGKVNRGIFETKDGLVITAKEYRGISREHLNGLKENDQCNVNLFGLQQPTLQQLCQLCEQFKQEHKGNRTIEAIHMNFFTKLIGENKLNLHYYTSKGYWIGITNIGDEKIVKEYLLESL